MNTYLHTPYMHTCIEALPCRLGYALVHAHAILVACLRLDGHTRKAFCLWFRTSQPTSTPSTKAIATPGRSLLYLQIPPRNATRPTFQPINGPSSKLG